MTLRGYQSKFSPINQQLFINLNKSVSNYLLSYTIKSYIDKVYFFSLLKKNNELQLNKDDVLFLTNILIEIFKLTHKEYNPSFKNYFEICSDLLLMFYLQEKIEQDIYAPLNSELEKIKREIKETVESQIIEENLLLKKVKVASVTKGEHLLIEYLKI
jgi:hypothetical protein